MFVEIKYLNLLSPRLGKFKQTKDRIWNFRCFYCGDSQKNKNKARGFVFQHKGELMYKCHNCGISHPLGKLIQDMDPVLYKQYRLEKFTDQTPKTDLRKVKKIVSKTPQFKTNTLSNLVKLEDLNTTHKAKKYITSRGLPIEALYYTEKFKEWVNSVKPGTFQDVKHDEGRIIIPFKDKEGNVFGFQGRSLSSSGLRYITIMLEDQPKIFGLDRIDYEKTIYITEGPLDSLLLRNCVAMAGADISISGILGSDVVFVYDNEPRNKQITSRMEKHISDGHSIVIWPENIPFKDPNDMHMGKLPVQDIVESNTYKGLQAKLKFNQWKR